MNQKSDKNVILEMVRQTDDLPTLPIVVVEVTNLLNDPSSTPKQLTDIIKADQVLTSKILKMVNSAYYAIPGGVSTIERAIVFLGYNTIVQILLGLSMAQFSHLGKDSGISMHDFWKHSLAVGVTSDVIARFIGHQAPEEAFAAGLLHDIGKLGLSKLAGKKFGSAIATALKKGIPLKQSEREHGLPTHDMVGNEMGGVWRLPPALLAAINGHHLNYIVRSQIVRKEHQAIVDIVILANILVKRFEIGHGGNSEMPDIDKDLLDRIGLMRIHIPQIKGEMTRKIEFAKLFLDMLGEDL
ncbi:MAG: HDOD domain-containing protein [Deltaproteobacteria bacterium]|nr:HDOD domain-containing protein [Deltaproteobacteria bacterium]